MIEVTGLDRIEGMANAQRKIKELNKSHFDRLVAQYVAAGVEKEVAKVMAKTMIDYKIA